jgi:multicomponent Na+:H+ antiporter subunit D
MVAPTAALIGVGLALTLLAGPIFGYAQRAAATLTDGHSYREAVWGTSTPADDAVAEGVQP